MSVSGTNSASTLRTDARRNVERIRASAVDLFRAEGLTVPLESIAAAAKVSKATIFNRFGGRVGLIDAVIEEVVAMEFTTAIEEARTVDGIRERIRFYIGAIRALQYRLPAVNDVLLQTFPDSEPLMDLCRVGSEFHRELVEAGRAENVLPAEFTPDDFQAITVDNALALKFGRRPLAADYERRTRFILDGICLPA
ncbi:TetR/AcrR family transcriptional regulator [Brevibacterium spongiae]|uniref:TetR/AcrR family transcriptional regulator n=1 Tax=Brevibacterium spongiae TaxID=2909672 RepID=A0ABY5STW2_9MICO|nr:TetR/AcrR family transcriptional regulator [Brevibacterium spongiae]UVI36588.1 TetR/AcrR family transcriptional regulator [Brevibacterium spongiae]